MGFKDSVNKGLATISIRTETYMEISKIRTYIGTLTNESAQLTKQLGEQTYQMWKNEAIENDTVSVFCSEISQKECLIKEQEEKILELQKKSCIALNAAIPTLSMQDFVSLAANKWSYNIAKSYSYIANNFNSKAGVFAVAPSVAVLGSSK